MKPPADTLAPPTPLEALRSKFPTGSTVSYKDNTLRAKRKAQTGVVTDCWETGSGTLVVSVKLADSELDTLPENLTMVRLPHSVPTVHDERID